MNCHEAREWLIDADPDVLTHAEASPVAGHLQSCASCRAVVARLLTAQHGMHGAYLAVAPRKSAAEVAQQVLAGESKVLPITATRRGRRNVVAAASVLSLATAAAVLIAVVGRQRAPAAPAFQPAVVADTAVSSITVEVPEGRNAIVFTTRNPLISVIWIY
jgi:anti-sigma factor RsiW